MEEIYRWIKAKFLGNDEEVLVRQQEEDRSLFVDTDGNKIPVTSLDFTRIPEEPPFLKDWKEKMQKQEEEHDKTQSQLREMLSAMDARAIADHQEEIDERAYWRKLRGEIFAKIMERGGEFVKESELDWAVRCTRNVFDHLYEQHQEFLKEKES